VTIDRAPDDPVFLHSRREAIVILAVWGAFFAWVVPYCYLNGYTAPARPVELPLVLGMPAWVFWGVALPWVVAGLVSIALCLWFIQDDDLGPAPEDASEPRP
jgi:hypothetical protein